MWCGVGHSNRRSFGFAQDDTCFSLDIAGRAVNAEVPLEEYCGYRNSECIVTHMQRVLSTSDQRREVVIESAVVVFAKTGYLGTPIAAVAKHARISPAYVFKLFPSKEELFVAALERAFVVIQETLASVDRQGTEQTPDALLREMGAAYAALIGNRSLLMIQVHALSAADVPEIRAAFRGGLERVAKFVKARTGASDEAVQRFFAYGQLCHLITTVSLDTNKAAWARMLTAGIRHP